MPGNHSEKDITIANTSAFKKIMLIDDDQDDSSFIAEIINEISPLYSLIKLSSAESVLRILSVSEYIVLPNLIILDYNIVPTSGLDVLKKIKENPLYQHIPIAIYSSSLYHKHKNECLKAGVCSYLTKPNTVSRMREDVLAMLSLCS